MIREGGPPLVDARSTFSPSRAIRDRLKALLESDDVVAGAFLVGWALLHFAYYFPRLVDDLFISLRYAENLAHGNGAVYNLGERVEGYSSPAWMLLQSLGFLVHAEPVTFTKVIGIACFFASAFGLRAVAREIYGVEGWPSWIPAYACIASSYFVSWSVLGLETPLHVAALILCPLAIQRALTRSTWPTLAAASFALIVLGTTRPESPAYVALNVLSSLVGIAIDRDWNRARRLGKVVAPALFVLGALLVVRRVYYGELVPNTYFVKGAHGTFDSAKLAPLWKDGTPFAESALYAVGGATLIAASVRARAFALPASLLFCLYFTASVSIDWMPSLRHLLPVVVLAPLGSACLVAEMRAKGSTWSLVATMSVLLAAGFQQSSIDWRYGTSGEDRGVVRKSLAKWRDTVRAYRRIEPPHVERMDEYEMGQITMAWGVLETSDEPIANSWFAGRDIGAVGFYTGVRVFDTAGLVTKEVSRASDGSKPGSPSDALVRTMMARRPVAAEIYEGWDDALGRLGLPEDRYRIRRGSLQDPIAFIATDRTRPSHDAVVERYRAFAAKFPRLYHVHTLYGESLGAVVERRLRSVEKQTAPSL